MNADSERQHDNFARQLSAFEKLLVITHSYHDAEQLYTRLKVSYISTKPSKSKNQIGHFI